MARPIHPTIFALALLVAFVSGMISVGAEPKSAQAARVQKKRPLVPLPLLPAEQIWITTLDAQPAAGGAMDAERVYIPIQSERLQTVSRATGETLWRRDIETAWPPLVRARVLYVAASDEIHALAADTGEQIWRAPFDHPMTAAMATAGDLLIGVFESGEVVAFALADGRIVWRHELGSPSRHIPVSDGARVFLALDDGRVVALDATSGALAWEQRFEGALSQPLVVRDRVLVGSDRNRLYALDDKRGRVAWTWKSGGDVIGVGADTKGGLYYASLDNVLRAVNRGNGNQRWITQIPTRPALPPETVGDGVVYEEIVVLMGATSEIDAFATTTGRAAGMYVPPSDIMGRPLIDPVLRPYAVAMVVITRDGRAIGLRPSSMALAEPMTTPVTELPGRRLARERVVPAAR